MILRRHTKALVALSASGVLMVALSGCGQKTAGADAGTTAKAGSTVNYWTSWAADTPQGKIFSAEAKDFTKESGIKVNIRVLGSTAEQDIVNASATGNGPDMFDDSPDHVPGYRKAGLIANLDDVLAAEPYGETETIKSIYPPSVLESASDSKGLAFIPHTVLSGGVWYDAHANPDIAANPPKTWDDMIALLSKLKSEGKVPVAQEGGNPDYNILWFYWLMLRAKGPGGLYNLSQSASAWDDPAVLAAAQQVAKLRTSGFFQSGYEGSRYPNAQNDWAQGKYVLDLNGSWLAGEVKPVTPAGADLTTFPFPSYTANSHDVQEINTLGWSVNAKGKNPAGAKEFIEYLVRKDSISKVATEALNIPARKDVQAPKALQPMQQSVLNSKETTGYMDNAATKASSWFQNVMEPLDDQLLFGQVTPQQFVAQGKAKTAASVKDNGA